MGIIHLEIFAICIRSSLYSFVRTKENATLKWHRNYASSRSKNEETHCSLSITISYEHVDEFDLVMEAHRYFSTDKNQPETEYTRSNI